LEEIRVCPEHDVQGALKMGESDEFQMNNKEYEVTLMIIHGHEPNLYSRFIINDIPTSDLSEGDRFTLKNEIILKVHSLYSNDIKTATFCLQNTEEGTHQSVGD